MEAVPSVVTTMPQGVADIIISMRVTSVHMLYALRVLHFS